MNPKAMDKSVLQNAEPNQPLASTIEYEEKLFNKTDIRCLNSCIKKLTFLENSRVEFDSAFELSAEEDKMYKAMVYIPIKIEESTKDRLSVSILLQNLIL